MVKQFDEAVTLHLIHQGRQAGMRFKRDFTGNDSAFLSEQYFQAMKKKHYKTYHLC